MRIRWHLAFLVLAFCIFGTRPTHAANQAPVCDLKRVAELETKIEDNILLVKVKLNDRDSWLRIATASPYNVVSDQIADELKLPPKNIGQVRIYDGSGGAVSKFVSINKVTLAGATAENVRFIVMKSSTNLPQHGFEGGLGAAFLSVYDVELDMPHNKMALYSQDHCKGQVVYWTHNYVTIPFTVDDSLHISFPVTLNGKTVDALLDTSTDGSKLSAKFASQYFGFDPGEGGIKTDGYAGTQSDPLRFNMHRFETLDIGGVTFRNTELAMLQESNGTGKARNRQRHTTLGYRASSPWSVTHIHLLQGQSFVCLGGRTRTNRSSRSPPPTAPAAR